MTKQQETQFRELLKVHDKFINPKDKQTLYKATTDMVKSIISEYNGVISCKVLLESLKGINSFTNYFSKNYGLPLYDIVDFITRLNCECNLNDLPINSYDLFDKEVCKILLPYERVLLHFYKHKRSMSEFCEIYNVNNIFLLEKVLLNTFKQYENIANDLNYPKYNLEEFIK